MRLLLIILFSLLNLDNSEGIPNHNSSPIQQMKLDNSIEAQPTNPIEDSVYTDVIPVAELLELVPDSIEVQFCNVLRDFAKPRGFDWRLILLVMYNESSLNPQEVGHNGLTSYVGLIMFGTMARKELDVTRKQVLAMNHVEQAKLAVRMWEKVEAWGNRYKIRDFLSLQLATFSPAWIPYRHQEIFPADSLTKVYNKTLVDVNGNITKSTVLGHYKAKVLRNDKLKFFQKYF